MRRAAALAVRKCVEAPVAIGLMKSSHDISASGISCTSRIETALKETSMPPALRATLPACSSTARSSRASTSAASAAPPEAETSEATASTPARLRPARKTLAPSRTNARATAPPTAPPPRRSRRSCPQVTSSSLPFLGLRPAPPSVVHAFRLPLRAIRRTASTRPRRRPRSPRPRPLWPSRRLWHTWERRAWRPTAPSSRCSRSGSPRS